MALLYEVHYRTSNHLESIADNDPRLESVDKMKEILLGSWDAAVGLGSEPRRIRIGNTVASDLMTELVSSWWNPTEFTPDIVGLRDGTVFVSFDPGLADNQILID